MEYLRPWKLVSLALGITVLIAGAFYYQYRDWDIGLSVLMALMTYLTAPKAVHALLKPSFMGITGAIVWWLLTVDASYVLYNSAIGHADFIVREENFTTSSCLYWMCGIVWSWNYPLKEFK